MPTNNKVEWGKVFATAIPTALLVTGAFWTLGCMLRPADRSSRWAFTPLFASLDMGKLNGAIIIEDAEFQSLKPAAEEV